jgi:hypothetical protein
MKHSGFYTGMEFFTAAGKWRCTDVGSRVIVAISLDAREMMCVHYDENKNSHEERFVSTDPSNLIGPPYGVVEYVFDEYDLEGRYISPEEA